MCGWVVNVTLCGCAGRNTVIGIKYTVRAGSGGAGAGGYVVCGRVVGCPDDALTGDAVGRHR